MAKICWISLSWLGDSTVNYSIAEFVSKHISKGGFVSVPPVVASKLLGVPVCAHESDLSTGLANKIAINFATTMFDF